MQGSHLLLLLLLITIAQGDLLHYYKLKKFITAVAFARALGRRPSILPIPIPIPIPISQNEVIRLPASKAKSYTLMGSPKYSSGRGGFTGSSSFGYPLPGTFDSASSSLGGSKVIMIDGNNILDGGTDFASSSNIIRWLSGKPKQVNRHPGRIILSGGGRTMRISEYMDLLQQPVRQFNEPVLTSIPTPPSKKQKKPIPVGERFRLP